MEKEECEEKPREPHGESEDKEEDEDNNHTTDQKENQHHSVSLPGSKSPSPPRHSLSDSSVSSISDDHRSVNHEFPPIVDERVSPPVVTAHRFQVEPKVVTKVDPGAEEGFVGVKDIEQTTAVTGNRRLRPDVKSLLRVKKVAALNKILTYLLMSASSSAATRAYDWESNWGEDKFPYMANASVALSFVAFSAFALASLVSGSLLCRFR